MAAEVEGISLFPRSTIFSTTRSPSGRTSFIRSQKTPYGSTLAPRRALYGFFPLTFSDPLREDGEAVCHEEFILDGSTGIAFTSFRSVLAKTSVNSQSVEMAPVPGSLFQMTTGMG